MTIDLDKNLIFFQELIQKIDCYNQLIFFPKLFRMAEAPPDISRFKVILLGDAGVGKTSLAKRQSQGTFDFKMNPTVGAAHMKSPMTIDGKQIELMIWDTAGQEQFASLVPMYARNANVCILVASIVNPDSCHHLTTWQERLYASGEKPPIVVAINKIDLLEGAPLSMDDIRTQYGEKFPTMFFVSARTGDSVEQLFQQVATEALDSKPTKQTANPQPVEKKASGCNC